VGRSTTTVIAAGTTVSGRIEGAEDIEVLGTIKGSVVLDGAMRVDEDARVEADLELTSLDIHGIVVGNVTASERITLHASARVIGDLTTPRVVLDDGALFRGAIDMGEAPDEGSARPARARKSARSAAPAARPARAPKSRAAAAKAPPSEPEADDADEEPELPAAASAKKVSVKKRK
jgi:cytoskeletal protein CcmA (bactofilin family)